MPITLKESIFRGSKRLPRNDAVLQGRLELLDDADRILLESVIIANQPVISLARIMGKNEKCLRRRISRLMKRITCQEFTSAARALAYLSSPDARLAKDYFCRGFAIRKLTEIYGQTFHRVRSRLDSVKAKISTIDKYGKIS